MTKQRDNGRGEGTRRGGDEVTLNNDDTVKMSPENGSPLVSLPPLQQCVSAEASLVQTADPRISACAINTVFSVGRGRINLSAWTYTDTCSAAAGHGDPRAMGLEGGKRMKKRERERERLGRNWRREKEFWYSLPHCQGHTKGRWRERREERVWVSEAGWGRRRWGVWKARDSLKRMMRAWLLSSFS